MLTMRMDELNADATMIVRVIRVRVLKYLAAELEAGEKEAGGEEEAT
jgi:hypothetical protein